MPNATFPAISATGTGQLYARFVTTLGNIVVRLEEQRAPKTVKNFVGLASGTQEWADPATGKLEKGAAYYEMCIRDSDPPGDMNRPPIQSPVRASRCA